MSVPILIAVFLATLPLVVIVGNDDPASLPQAVWLQVAVLILWIMRLARSKVPTSHTVRAIVWPVAAFLAWSALSTFWAVDLFASQRVLLCWMAAVGLAFLIPNTIDSTVQARHLLLALFGASVVVAGVGLLQHLGGWNALPQAYPPAGTMGHKNVAAIFVAAMAPVGVLGFATANITAPLFSMALGMAFAFVLHTGCRAAWLALAAQLLAGMAFFVTRRVVPRWSSGRLISICCGGALFAILAAQTPSDSSIVQGRAGQLLVGAARPILRLVRGGPEPLDLRSPADQTHEERAERSVSIRLGIWRNTLEMIRSAPLAGVGIGNFPVHYPRFAGRAVDDGTRIDERVDGAHNDYFQLIAELGFVGALLLGWVALTAARNVSVGFESRSDKDQSLNVAAGLGFLALLVGAAVSSTVNQPVALAAAATFLGITLRRGLPVSLSLSAVNPAREGGSFWAPNLSLTSAAALLVVMCAWGFAQIRADRHRLTMAYAEARQDWPAVVREGLMARHFNPGRMDARFATASAMLRLGQAGQAAEMLQELTAADPYNANALGNLGIAYVTLGDTKQAVISFERVLLLRPDDKSAQALLHEARARAHYRVTAPDEPS